MLPKIVSISENHSAGQHLASVTLEFDIQALPLLVDNCDTSGVDPTALQSALDTAAAVAAMRLAEHPATRPPDPPANDAPAATVDESAPASSAAVQ